jgi:hypothetical protein
MAYSCQALKPAWKFIELCYSKPSLLFLFDRTVFADTIPSLTGIRQGDVFGSLLFCISVHEILQQAIIESGCTAVAICDDFTFVGPPVQVRKALDWLVSNISQTADLQVKLEKCLAFFPLLSALQTDTLLFSSPGDDRPLIPVQVGGALPLLGSAVGLDDHKKQLVVTERVAEIKQTLTNLLHSDIPQQHAFHLLRSSICMQITYLLRTLPPSVTLVAAEDLKKSITDFVVKKCALPKLSQYALDVLFLPTSLAGLGFQDPTVVARTGYFSSIAACLPLLCSVQSISDADESDSKSNVLTWKRIYSDLPEPGKPPHPVLGLPGAPSYVNIKSNLADCLDYFRAHNVLSQINQLEFLFPDNLDQFEAIYNDGSRGGDRLQRLLSRGVASTACTSLRTKFPANTPEGARLQTLNQEHANHWLTVHGTHPSLRLGDPAFRFSVCFRLGLLPFFFPPEHPKLECDKSCKVDLLKDPYHRLHCNKENKRGRYHQHNNIQAQLVSFARSFGLSAHQTPANYRSPDDQRTPDASILLGDHTLIVDVSGIDTLAPSHLARNKYGADKLNAANDRDKRKLKTYVDLENKFNVRVVPFLYDLLGGIHPSAVDTLKEIAKCGEEDSTHGARLRRVHRCISNMSVAIQRDNADMIRAAFQSAQL